MAPESIDKELSKMYCPRFGEIAVKKGFITIGQLKEALMEQVDDDVAGKPHRILGRILSEKGFMTYQQIDLILNELFKDREK